MTKFHVKQKKIIYFLLIFSLLILGIFNLNTVYAMHMQGEGATFHPDEEHPIQYGVFIPEPNMYATMAIDASNQGEFTIMNAWGTPIAHEVVDFPGKDISYAYPWYFEDYLMDSTTNNDYINPWADIQWLNISSYFAENDTVLPYTLNSVFNYYGMHESGNLVIPLNSSIPIQVDITIATKGPKIMKIDWLIDDPTENPLYLMDLISPSGNIMDIYTYPFPLPAYSYWIGMSTIHMFNYIPFVAHESGTYRLLLNASYDIPGYLNLEFINSHVTELDVNKVTFGGDGDEWPSGQEQLNDEWDAEWYKIKGKKGDKLSLDFGLDYVIYDPVAYIYYPCEFGYDRRSLSPGTLDLYFPTDGYIYLSFTDYLSGAPYRTSFYLKEITALDYNIGDNITSIKVSRDQRKAIDFTIENDSFVRFNYTYWGAGNAYISSMNTPNGFIFRDAKKLYCYDILEPLLEKPVEDTYFYYYYFPAGAYEAIIKNDDIRYDGVLQINSEYVEFINDTIPINSVSYPNFKPTNFITLDFTPDDLYPSIKNAQWIGFEVTEPGQFFLNTTILASDNLAQIPTTANPSYVILYNDTAEEYFDYTSNAINPALSFDSVESEDDFLYIAYPSKWHDMEFNFTTTGTPDGDITLQIPYSPWWNNKAHTDNTNNLQDNESIVIDFTWAWDDWVKGVDEVFDLPGIEEDDYYWARLDVTTGNPYTVIPEISLIKLSNITIHGDINFALVRDSGYKYCDFWNPLQPTSIIIEDPDRINQEPAYLSYSNLQPLLSDTDPYIIGVEPGYYKLLIVPHEWSHPGNLKIQFGISDYKNVAPKYTYNIIKEPLVYPFNITNGNVTAPFVYNYTTYPFEQTRTFNNTLIDWGGSYLFVDCYGTAYQWTQLVISTYNISSYDVWIMQDLPWWNNDGPYGEIVPLNFGLSGNNTIEFGVLTDNFTLIFSFDESFPDETVTFRFDLSQYNTTRLNATVPVKSYKAPSKEDNTTLIWGLAIGIPVAAGIIILLAVLKKKGRILSKTP